MKHNSIINDFLDFCLRSGKITVDDLVSLTTEEIMSNILTNVHKHKISKGKDGRWNTRVPDKTKPNGLRSVKKATQSELFAYLLEFYGLAVVSKSLDNVYREWVEYKKTFVNAKNKPLSISTTTRYLTDYENTFDTNEIIKRPISTITSIELENAFKAVIAEHNLNESYFKNVFSAFTQMFDYAERSDYIIKNPIKRIDKNKMLTFCNPDPISLKPNADIVMSDNQCDILIQEIVERLKESPEYSLLYAVLLSYVTGMRPSEIVALHWSDIRDGIIYIDYAEHRLDFYENGKKWQQYVIAEPKCRKHRMIPMSDEIQYILDCVADLKQHSDEDFIFINEDGEHYRANNLSCLISRISKKTGVKFTITKNRKTISSKLNELLPRTAVSSMMGHLARTNEQYYDYDTTNISDKINALNQVSQNVTRFSDYKNKLSSNKKVKNA